MWTAIQHRNRKVKYRHLIEPHVSHLLRVAAQRTGDRFLAEDLVQESCLAAWENLDDLKSAQAARAWLVSILLRQVASNARAQARRHRLLPITTMEESHWQTIASDDEGPLQRTLAAIDNERIARMLRELPADFAVVVELHDIEEYRYREIAEVLDIPIGTVMSRLSRGRRLLGVLMTEDHSDEPARDANTRKGKTTP